jgi:AraC-like DNA-binding protein
MFEWFGRALTTKTSNIYNVKDSNNNLLITLIKQFINQVQEKALRHHMGLETVASNRYLYISHNSYNTI